jgi:hypothetical protein
MSLQLPRTLEAALDPSWLSQALSPGDGAGRRVLRAEVVEAVQVDQTIKATRRSRRPSFALRRISPTAPPRASA